MHRTMDETIRPTDQACPSCAAGVLAFTLDGGTIDERTYLACSACEWCADGDA